MTKEEKNQAINELKLAIKCASKDSNRKPVLYTEILSVSRSGMYRNIAVYIVDMKNAPKGQIWNISPLIAKAEGLRLKEVCGTPCLGVSGCGMDMGYEIVSTVSYLLTDWKDYRTLTHQWL